MKRQPGLRTAVRYAFDGQNRLMVEERGGSSGALRSARIVDGTLTTDSSNRLVYHAESPVSAPGAPATQTLNLDGTWGLSPNHELLLTLRGSDRQPRQTLYLKGALLAARANALVFALRREDGAEGMTSQRLTLSGRWRADDENRFNFLVGKADGSEDRLTLQGGWEVGEHHELLYRYRRRSSGRRLRADEHTLAFEGAWDIAQADRLVYRLEGSSDSAFEFRAALQSPSLLARDGRITYQLGVGLSGGQVRRQHVTLFGKWKLNRDLSVSFEIPYGNGRARAIRFEGEARLGPRDRIAVALHNSRRERLGLTVTFTRELAPDAELFVQLRKEAEERSAVGGVAVRF